MSTTAPATVAEAEALIDRAENVQNTAEALGRQELERAGADSSSPYLASALGALSTKLKFAKDGDGTIPPGIAPAVHALSATELAVNCARTMRSLLKHLDQGRAERNEQFEIKFNDALLGFDRAIAEAEQHIAIHGKVTGANPVLQGMLAAGGKLWTTEVHIRVYFDRDVWGALAGFDSGSRNRYARLTETISKVYYDAGDGIIHVIGRDSDLMTLEEAADAIREGIRGAAGRAIPEESDTVKPSLDLTAAYTVTYPGDSEPTTIVPQVKTKTRGETTLTVVSGLAPLLADRIDAITDEGNRLATLTTLAAASIVISDTPREDLQHHAGISARDHGKLSTGYVGHGAVSVEEILDLAEQLRAQLGL